MKKETQNLNAKTGSPQNGEPVYLALGFFRRPHGVRGEILFQAETDYPERIQPGKTYYLGKKHRPITLRSRRNHNKGLLLGIEGINDRDEIGAYRHQTLYLNINEWDALPKGEYYDFELVGLTVIEEESEKVLGELKEIIKTGANDVFVVKPKKGKEILLPDIPAVIRDIDLARGEMTVYLIPGLVE